jgi:hypothetical protein
MNLPSFVPSAPPSGRHSVEGVASSRDVKGSVEPPHSMTKSGAENDYDFLICSSGDTEWIDADRR